MVPKLFRVGPTHLGALSLRLEEHRQPTTQAAPEHSLQQALYCGTRRDQTAGPCSTRSALPLSPFRFFSNLVGALNLESVNRRRTPLSRFKASSSRMAQLGLLN